MLKAMSKNSVILATVALLTTGLVVLTHLVTKDRIEHQAELKLLSVLNQVIPKGSYDNALHQSCLLISANELNPDESMPVFVAKKADQPVAMAIQAIAPDGYSGAIRLLIGLDMNNTVLGVRVLQHNETPGLGDKADLDVSDWILSFNNKTIESETDKRWKVKKDGGDFDQFTGATITPRAIVNATRRAVWFVSQNRDQLLETSPPCGETHE